MARLTAMAAVLASGCGSAQAPAATDGHNWRTYTNVHYRFQICYPADLLKAQGESANSDGQTFSGGDGAELSVFGRNAVDGATLASTVRDDAKDLTGAKGAVSYHAAKPGWEVTSGTTDAGKLFYSKTFQRGDQFAIFELTYPKAQAARYAAVSAKLSRCFALTH